MLLLLVTLDGGMVVWSPGWVFTTFVALGFIRGWCGLGIGASSFWSSWMALMYRPSNQCFSIPGRSLWRMPSALCAVFVHWIIRCWRGISSLLGGIVRNGFDGLACGTCTSRSLFMAYTSLALGQTFHTTSTVLSPIK